MGHRIIVWLGIVLAGAFGSASATHAQTLGGPVSFRQLVRNADAVVRARILDGPPSITADGRSCPVVHADVLETIKGPPAPGTLTFANLGAGAATFVPGDEVLLFLQHSERLPELAATPLQTRLRYAALPNAGEKVALTDTDRATITGAVRGYAAVEAIPDPDVRTEQLRQLTLEILKGGSPVLIAAALRDVGPAGDAAALTVADLPALVPLMESPRVPIGTRIAVVAELERRGVVFGPARWVRLIRTSQGDDLLAVIRAVRDHPSAGVDAQLFPLLAGADLTIATAAAAALGVPGNVEAVRPLATALGRDDAALRIAVVDSLARIGTQSARQALEFAAARHPDPATRRHAATEALVVARRNGTTLAPSLGVGAAEPSLAAIPGATTNGALR